MRLRKELDEMQERDILLIAKISDALAHPARIKIFRYIMTSNKKESASATRISSIILTTRRLRYPSM